MSEVTLFNSWWSSLCYDVFTTTCGFVLFFHFVFLKGSTSGFNYLEFVVLTKLPAATLGKRMFEKQDSPSCNAGHTLDEMSSITIFF